MAWVFDWHGQDSRATGPLDVACTVTQTYGAGGQHADGSGCFVQGQHAGRRRKPDEHGNNTDNRPRQNDHSAQNRSCGPAREHY